MRFISVVAAVVVLASAGAAVAKCKDRNGDFTSVLLPPPGCTSPVGVCTLGTLTGDFPGTYNFTMDTLVASDDDPDLFSYTGHSVITDARGAVLFGSDTGVLVFNVGSPSPFITTVDIVAGTRGYKHTSGQFVATGEIDFLTGQGIGTYTATLCKGGGHQD